MHSLKALLDKPFALMGIVNATPDSFFDGGEHYAARSAADHARRLVDEGADVIDIGGESTRPGAKPVTAGEEIRRVVPAVTMLRSAGVSVPISVDTTKAEVARTALDAGADWINDVSAGRFDTDMAPLAARRECPVVLMHSRKTPETMQQEPHYEDVAGEVCDELRGSVDHFRAAGVRDENIVLDPGIGFAKRYEDNMRLLRNLEMVMAMGYPVLIGTSRKSFIGHLTGKPVEQRLCGTLGSVAAAYAHGGRFFRVHDVDATRDFLTVLSTIDSRG
jgi:dihydropteroate synthase